MRSAPAFSAAAETAKSSPRAQLKRFSPLMPESIISPGNQEWSFFISSLLAKPT
jgi:hypothetical protein